MTIFKKILSGEIETDFIYEDEKCVAFYDISPQAPVHVLIIPRQEIPMLEKVAETDAALLGHLLVVAKKIAEDKKLMTGYRVVINNGVDACQTVYHLHVHLLGGRGFSWPPG